MTDIPKDLIKATKVKKTSDTVKALEKLSSLKDKTREIRILASTQPKLASLERNTPDIIEIKVGGGSIDQQLEYAKELLGKTVSASQVFKPGESIDLAGVTKGKGFQGVVKRHKFTRGPMSHGSHHHREPGSVGMREKPGRILKGKRMPGHMGGDQLTLKHRPVVACDPKAGVFAVKGPVPGPSGTAVYITIESSAESSATA